MSPLVADFVAEVADKKGKLRLGVELEPLAATRSVGSGGFEVTVLTPQRGYNATWCSRHTWGGQRWRPGDERSQPAQVLGDRRQRELELGTARPTQSQAPKPQDALEMCKQHLNAFPITARSLECFGLGQCPSNVTSLLVDAARHPTEGRLWAALRLQQAATAVTHAGHIEKCLAIVDQPARRREGLASRAGVHVALFVEPEVVPTEGPILAPRLVDDRDVGSDLLVLD